jgi:hypothetical protein
MTSLDRYLEELKELKNAMPIEHAYKTTQAIPKLISIIEEMKRALEYYAEGNGNSDDDAQTVAHPTRHHWYDWYGKEAREALARANEFAGGNVGG